MTTDGNGRAHTPAGTRDGGRFAAQHRTEAAVKLGGRTRECIEEMIAAGELSPAARTMDPHDALEQWAQANAVDWARRAEQYEAAGLRMRMRADELVDGDRFDVRALLADHGEVDADEMLRQVDGDVEVQMVQPAHEAGRVYVQMSDDDGGYLGQMWIPDGTRIEVVPSPWRCRGCGRDTEDGEGDDGLCRACADALDTDRGTEEAAGVCDRCERPLNARQAADGYCPDCG